MNGDQNWEKKTQIKTVTGNKTAEILILQQKAQFLFSLKDKIWNNYSE